ncbi:hypothetical protein ACJ41O_010754 [Fusarium nematophilum]
MALMLAPYNSAMRLGMGFNSYTQTLCVNDVVRKPGNVPATEADLRAAQLTQQTDAATAKPKQITTGTQERPPQGVLDGASGSISRKLVDGQKEVSQVVSWEASFVENSSDVLKKLDVSGALSIKMAGLGQLSGKAAFVDSADLKKADIKYLVHVKVVNQRLVADNISEFAPIDHIDPGQFTEIYGDCFISGFIEGGDFDALVTITTEDTLKKNSISGGLELSANIDAVDVSGSVQGRTDGDSTLKNAQTKISVTWSGGGDIRSDDIQEWNLQTLKKVAMGFPDAVAACKPRNTARSVAILTKYSSLRSYHEQTKKGSPLDYENAGVYTATLYDAYTQDYKIMWNQIHSMISGLNKNELELYVQNPSDGLTKYAAIAKKEQEDKEAHYKELVEARKAEQDAHALVPFTGTRSQALEPIEKPMPSNKVEVYGPDVFGLEEAARDCRFEMIKIVREVDAVTKDPKVACDPYRTSQYLGPSIFKMLIPTPHKERLPTYEEWSTTKGDLEQQKKDVKARQDEIDELKKKLETALITPTRDESGTLLTNTAQDIAELHPKVQTSLSQLSHRADDYRMQSLLEDKNSISTGATFFNDLETLEVGARPTELRLWSDDKKIKGVCVVYASKEIAHGTREGNPQHVLQLAYDEVITEIEAHVVKGAGDKLSVTAIALATSRCNILSAGTKSNGKTHSFSMADYRQWSFRGFFGFVFDDGFEDLGVVWSKDTAPTAATSTVQMPPAKNLLGMGSSLQQKAKAEMSETKSSEHFYLGDCVSTGSPSAATSFSALDTIDGTSKMSKISFSVSAGRLGGLKVEYSDGKQATHGAYSQASEAWSCDVKAPVVAAKLTVGTTRSNPAPFVDSVELVCGDANGGLPLWPLDVSTIRYLGDHKPEDQLEVVSNLTEQAPKLGRANWTLRGFYGEESQQGLITRLGLIWGCA